MGIDISEVVFGLIAIVTAISLHEMMHAFTGYYLGDDTAKLQGRITANPLAHIDPLTTIVMPLVLLIAGAPPIGAARPVPFNPTRVKGGENGVALIAFMGPFTNFILAVIGSIGVRLSIDGGSALATEFFLIFTLVNTGFFVFNLLPIPPLDGSRVLYAFAPDSIRDFFDMIERMGFIVMIVVLIVLYPVLRPVLIDANEWVLNLLF